MDSLEIEAFLAVVRYGSLTEAANSLFLSQSTLSHRLAELERKVGVSLIDRGRGLRSLTLNDYGKEFLVIARRWDDLLQDTKRIQSRTKTLSLSIGAVDTIHTYVLPPLYQMLREHAHDMNIRMKTHNSTELYLKVDSGEMDVAFTLLDLPMRNIVVKKFFTEPRVVLRKETPGGRCNELIDLDSLDADKEVFFEGDPLFQEWYSRWKGAVGYPNTSVDTAQLLLPLLNCPGNWAIVPRCMAQKLISTGTFSYYRLKGSPPERVCYMIQSQYPKTSVVESLKILESCLDDYFIESLVRHNE